MSESSASASAADPLPLPLGEGRGEGVVRRTGSAADEAEWLARAVAGEQAAADWFVTAHQEQITRLVYRLLGWSGEIDDVVQDVFVDALQNLSRFDRRSKVATWLTRIAINRCRSYQRKQWIRREFLRKLLRVGSDGTAEPEQTIEVQETVQQVHAALGKLKQEDREIVVLRYLEEMPIEEIAHSLGVTRGAADVRLTRARQRLERILEPLVRK
ncbi:MAG TPA: RNA polymerase sigma factor [Pirellulales bacterium]